MDSGSPQQDAKELLEDKDKWWDKTSLLKECYESRKRERINEDGSFMPNQKGPITSTYTADWFLWEGEGRELLGERMKMTLVRSQDRRRMLQATSHTFPSNGKVCEVDNDWIRKITKLEEKNRISATCVRHSG